MKPLDLTDERLAGVARELDKSRDAAALLDADLNLVWVSEELRLFLTQDNEAEILYGHHIVKNYLSETWCRLITEESQLETMQQAFPYLAFGTPGGKDGLKEIFLRSIKEYYHDGGDRERPEWTEALGDSPEAVVDAYFTTFDPVKPPSLWSSAFDFIQGDLPPMRINEAHIRLMDDDGEIFGWAMIYHPALPARVGVLVSRGDEEMLSRMAQLFEPGRRAAAILFADLQDSGALSRRLPSGAYFKLVRALTTEIDAVVVEYKGIVGKHAGDGVTAFFLSDDAGSASQAARAAIEAARGILTAAGRVAKEVAEETGLIEAADCRVNVGVHWGGTLYMGQLVTGGRLEVTALGDAVTEAARIQESARDGEILVSKSLLEHLTDQDSEALQIDPDVVVYRTVAELDHASPKAKRDAGGLPVTVL